MAYLLRVFILLCFNYNTFGKKSEWIDMNPNESGIKNCRRCTFEFKKLEKREQAFWKELVGIFPLEKIRGDNPEFFKKFYYLRQFTFSGLETIMLGGDNTEWNSNLSKAEKELLDFYFIARLYNDEQKTEALQNLFIKMCMILSWRKFENMFVKTHEHFSQPGRISQQQRPFLDVPIIPPLTSNFTVLGHYEL